MNASKEAKFSWFCLRSILCVEWNGWSLPMVHTGYSEGVESGARVLSPGCRKIIDREAAEVESSGG